MSELVTVTVWSRSWPKSRVRRWGGSVVTLGTVTAPESESLKEGYVSDATERITWKEEPNPYSTPVGGSIL